MRFIVRGSILDVFIPAGLGAWDWARCVTLSGWPCVWVGGDAAGCLESLVAGVLGSGGFVGGRGGVFGVRLRELRGVGGLWWCLGPVGPLRDGFEMAVRRG